MSPPAQPLVSERLLTSVGAYDGDVNLLEDGLELPGGHEGVLAPAGDPAPGPGLWQLLRLGQTRRTDLRHRLPVQADRQPQQSQVIVQRASKESLVKENITENSVNIQL